MKNPSRKKIKASLDRCFASYIAVSAMQSKPFSMIAILTPEDIERGKMQISVFNKMPICDVVFWQRLRDRCTEKHAVGVCAFLLIENGAKLMAYNEIAKEQDAKLWLVIKKNNKISLESCIPLPPEEMAKCPPLLV